MVTYKMDYVSTTFTLKMNSNDKILRDNIVNKQHINVLKLPQNFDLRWSSPTTLTLSPIWVIGISLFFPYRPCLRCQVQVPSTLYVFLCFESSIQTIYIGPAELPLIVISFKNLNFEISKGRGLLVKI